PPRTVSQARFSPGEKAARSRSPPILRRRLGAPCQGPGNGRVEPSGVGAERLRSIAAGGRARRRCKNPRPGSCRAGASSRPGRVSGIGAGRRLPLVTGSTAGVGQGGGPLGKVAGPGGSGAGRSNPARSTRFQGRARALWRSAEDLAQPPAEPDCAGGLLSSGWRSHFRIEVLLGNGRPALA